MLPESLQGQQARKWIGDDASRAGRVQYAASIHRGAPDSGASHMRSLSMSKINKVVLAYSGGLDTSVIVKWLQDTYDCEVVTFTADIGQGEEVEPARAKAKAMGVKEIYIEDLREEFVCDYVFPMFRANTIYEGEYLLGTSIARPLIAKRLVEIAEETGADAISHGATLEKSTGILRSSQYAISFSREFRSHSRQGAITWMPGARA